MNNPLASAPRQTPEPHPMMGHAQMWQHMHSQDDDALQGHVAMLDYGLPIMGALLAKKNLTAKDVIKATSGAVAEGKVAPSAGVAMITEMPADADKVRPWLQQKYAMNLSAAVHAKAAMMSRAQPQQPQGQQMPAPMPPPGVMPNG